MSSPRAFRNYSPLAALKLTWHQGRGKEVFFVIFNFDSAPNRLPRREGPRRVRAADVGFHIMRPIRAMFSERAGGAEMLKSSADLPLTSTASRVTLLMLFVCPANDSVKESKKYGKRGAPVLAANEVFLSG